MTAEDQHRFRAILQSATVSALMDFRRWQPGELAFQGGSCLHLVHGSARFSEDLDFMVRGGLSLQGLAKDVQRRLQFLVGVPADMAVTVAPSRETRNPHAFMVTLGGPHVIGSAKVKIELWQTDEAALNSLKLLVRAIPSPSGMQAFVPTLTLEEVFADKVYALGARARLKARDVFDLWWLCEQKAMAVDAQTLCTRLDIYPGERMDRTQTAHKWLAGAARRLADLRGAATAAAVSVDLRRWLPSSWKMNDAVAATMIAVAEQKLQEGVAMMTARFPRGSA
ncbi:MAG: nucleotidyl transferase AbiEii/AbiGii toxin family protein [Burkholderiales bacterium]